MPLLGDNVKSVIEIPPCSGVAFTLRAGSILTVIDLRGEQVADLLAFNLDDLDEVISNGRTFDYASSLRLTTGHYLYSNRSRPMLKIVRDDVGTHDFLLTACSVDTWRLCYHDELDRRPGCFGNLAAALWPHGIAPDRIPTTFNCFMNVECDARGEIRVRPPRSRAGDRLQFRAEMDLLVGLTACSAAQSNNGSFKPIGYEVHAEA